MLVTRTLTVGWAPTVSTRSAAGFTSPSSSSGSAPLTSSALAAAFCSAPLSASTVAAHPQAGDDRVARTVVGYHSLVVSGPRLQDGIWSIAVVIEFRGDLKRAHLSSYEQLWFAIITDFSGDHFNCVNAVIRVVPVATRRLYGTSDRPHGTIEGHVWRGGEHEQLVAHWARRRSRPLDRWSPRPNLNPSW